MKRSISASVSPRRLKRLFASLSGCASRKLPLQPAITSFRSTVAKTNLRVQSPAADDARMPDFALLINLLQLAVKNRTQLALENIALRHQLAVYKRSVKRPNINDSDRIFWLTVMRMLKDWRNALVFVQPDTVVRWRRKGFKHYWRKKSRAKPGRPSISMALIHLIRRMSQENVTWGAPRIVDELSLLGHEVDGRRVEHVGLIISSPALNGLDHRYSRVA